MRLTKWVHRYSYVILKLNSASAWLPWMNTCLSNSFPVIQAIFVIPTLSSLHQYSSHTAHGQWDAVGAPCYMKRKIMFYSNGTICVCEFFSFETMCASNKNSRVLYWLHGPLPFVHAAWYIMFFCILRKLHYFQHIPMCVNTSILLLHLVDMFCVTHIQNEMYFFLWENKCFGSFSCCLSSWLSNSWFSWHISCIRLVE